MNKTRKTNIYPQLAPQISTSVCSGSNAFPSKRSFFCALNASRIIIHWVRPPPLSDSTAESLGPIWMVHLWHDNGGPSPSWYVSHVLVRELPSLSSWFFLGECWLAVDEDDGKVEKKLMVCKHGLGFGKVITCYWCPFCNSHNLVFFFIKVVWMLSADIKGDLRTAKNLKKKKKKTYIYTVYIKCIYFFLEFI